MPRKKKKHIPTDSKGYERFLKSLDLVALGQESATYHLARSAYARLQKAKDRGVRKITAEYEVAQFNPEFFDVKASFKLTIEDQDKKELPLAIQCSFGSHFHGERPLDEQFARRFAKSEFRFLVWPFFRQFVFDVTGRMAIRPITIPLSEDA
jgi:preprotein translocase subunit SecB